MQEAATSDPPVHFFDSHVFESWHARFATTGTEDGDPQALIAGRGFLLDQSSYSRPAWRRTQADHNDLKFDPNATAKLHTIERPTLTSYMGFQS